MKNTAPFLKLSNGMYWLEKRKFTKSSAINTIGKPRPSDQFRKITKRNKKDGYNMDIMRWSACLVVNPIAVSYVFLFNCKTVDRVSDGPGVNISSVACI